MFDKKVKEKERLEFKYAKTQSQFLEIMRELTRFRREFNECYSLRSKFIMTKTISTDINNILRINQNVLQQEKSIQDHFFKKKNELFYRR